MSMSVREAANDSAAAAVKETLYEQRISERELARRMGVTQSWLNKRLTGEIPLRFGEVFEIASLLKVSLDKLAGDAIKRRFSQYVADLRFRRLMVAF